MIDGLSRRFAVDGFDLAWDRWGSGDGPPLVLCHGFSGSSHDFALQIEPLAAARTVTAIDHRGHGLSAKTKRAEDYSVERIAADVIAWLDAEVGGPVDLLGHSMGGRVVTLVALERPDLLRSLVLMDTTAWSFAPPDEGMREMYTSFFDSLTPDSTWPSIETPEDALIEAATTAEWRAIKAERDAGFDPMAAKAIGRALFTDELTPVADGLGEIAVPVTVIVGEHDGHLAEHAPRLAAAVSDGELRVIVGGFHSPQLTHPDEWRAAMTDHLERAAG